VTQQRTPEQLRDDIEQTRRELGETVERLSHKADVKAQVRAKREEVEARARENPLPLGAAGAGIVLGLVALWIIRRR
jgi:hypothetical protein